MFQKYVKFHIIYSSARFTCNFILSAALLLLKFSHSQTYKYNPCYFPFVFSSFLLFQTHIHIPSYSLVYSAKFSSFYIINFIHTYKIPSMFCIYLENIPRNYRVLLRINPGISFTAFSFPLIITKLHMCSNNQFFRG